MPLVDADNAVSTGNKLNLKKGAQLHWLHSNWIIQITLILKLIIPGNWILPSREKFHFSLIKIFFGNRILSQNQFGMKNKMDSDPYGHFTYFENVRINNQTYTLWFFKQNQITITSKLKIYGHVSLDTIIDVHLDKSRTSVMKFAIRPDYDVKKVKHVVPVDYYTGFAVEAEQEQNHRTTLVIMEAQFVNADERTRFANCLLERNLFEVKVETQKVFFGLFRRTKQRWCIPAEREQSVRHFMFLVRNRKWYKMPGNITFT